MEYTYEFLRKCHGLRFRATLNNKPQEGVVKVTRDGVILCYGEKDPGYLVTFGRRDTLSLSEQTLFILPSDFEIVPRDPETYQDWQVGDNIYWKGNRKNTCRVIFRSGELVVTNCASDRALVYSCSKLYYDGYRLVLTDIEKQISNEMGEAVWVPQDGDICYVKSILAEWLFIKKGDINETDTCACMKLVNDCVDLIPGHVTRDDMIEELRPATDEEKQRLFDAMAKKGKRWNAEKKVVEDIPKPYEFRKGEPVLVRNYEFHRWIIAAYTSKDELGFIANAGVSVIHWKYCIPYNEKTMHLLGTSEDYKEGE